jgi:hypothetical protein
MNTDTVYHHGRYLQWERAWEMKLLNVLMHSDEMYSFIFNLITPQGQQKDKIRYDWSKVEWQNKRLQHTQTDIMREKKLGLNPTQEILRKTLRLSEMIPCADATPKISRQYETTSLELEAFSW